MKDKYSVIDQQGHSVQIEHSGVFFWVPKRSIREDGTLTAKGLELRRKALLLNKESEIDETLYMTAFIHEVEDAGPCYRVRATNGTIFYLPCSAILGPNDVYPGKSYWVEARLLERKIPYRSDKYIWA